MSEDIPMRVSGCIQLQIVHTSIQNLAKRRRTKRSIVETQIEYEYNRLYRSVSIKRVDVRIHSAKKMRCYFCRWLDYVGDVEGWTENMVKERYRDYRFNNTFDRPQRHHLKCPMYITSYLDEDDIEALEKWILEWVISKHGSMEEDAFNRLMEAGPQGFDEFPPSEEDYDSKPF